MTIKEMERFFENRNEKKFRAHQVFKWISEGVLDFHHMTDLPKSLREELDRSEAYLSQLKILKVQESKADGTRKYLFQLEDGFTIESVFMRYRYGNSLCISSQAGCRMGCKFCASTIGGLKRNLTAGEMTDQILSVQRDTGQKVGHIVVMGTGEPFDNYDNLIKFIQIVHAKEGLNIGLRNITVSTCGLIPYIEKFAEAFPQVNLAISLHAPNSIKRSEIMPINKKYSMGELIAAAKKYAEKTGRRITYEYTLVDGFNDSLKHADELADRLHCSLCHVNLIPLNRVRETGLNSSDKSRAQKFKKRLEERGIPTTLRRELGSDIDAACGQLRLGS